MGAVKSIKNGLLKLLVSDDFYIVVGMFCLVALTMGYWVLAVIPMVLLVMIPSIPASIAKNVGVKDEFTDFMEVLHGKDVLVGIAPFGVSAAIIGFIFGHIRGDAHFSAYTFVNWDGITFIASIYAITYLLIFAIVYFLKWNDTSKALLDMFTEDAFSLINIIPITIMGFYVGAYIKNLIIAAFDAFRSLGPVVWLYSMFNSTMLLAIAVIFIIFFIPTVIFDISLLLVSIKKSILRLIEHQYYRY